MFICRRKDRKSWEGDGIGERERIVIWKGQRSPATSHLVNMTKKIPEDAHKHLRVAFITLCSKRRIMVLEQQGDDGLFWLGLAVWDEGEVVRGRISCYRSVRHTHTHVHSETDTAWKQPHIVFCSIFFLFYLFLIQEQCFVLILLLTKQASVNNCIAVKWHPL